MNLGGGSGLPLEPGRGDGRGEQSSSEPTKRPYTVTRPREKWVSAFFVWDHCCGFYVLNLVFLLVSGPSSTLAP
jgi:hypothetical protein